MVSRRSLQVTGRWVATALLAILASCQQPRKQEGLGGRSPVPMRPIPSRALARCLATPPVDVACPRAVPEPDAPYRSQTIEAPDGSAAAFDLAAGGPYPGLRRRNRPPRFAHIVVEASTRRLAWEFDTRPADLGTPPSRRRGEGLLLGRRSWTVTPGGSSWPPPFPWAGSTATTSCSRGRTGESTWRCRCTRGRTSTWWRRP